MRLKTLFISLLALLLMQAMAYGDQLGVTATKAQTNGFLKARTISTVASSANLGVLRDSKLTELRSLTSAGGKMFGAGDGKIVELNQNGQVVRTIPIAIKSPIISGVGSERLIIGDSGRKLVHGMDVKTGKTMPLLDLNQVMDRSTAMPGGSLIRELPFTAVASDGKFVYAAFSGGFSSPVFKIDPATRQIVGRSFSAGPNPVSMTLLNGKLLVLDQRSRQIRNHGADLKPTAIWTEVGAADARGIAIINNEVRVLSPASGGILRLKTDLSSLTASRSRLAAVSPKIIQAVREAMKPQKYAVLICGDIAEHFWGECFWNDTVWMYKTLLAAGYKPENIFVLYGYGVDYASANPKYQHPATVTDFPATIGWVNRVFDGLKNGDAAAGIPAMKANDTLFVWTFDHGAGSSPAYLCLWDGNMSDLDFAAKLNAVPYAKRMIFMQQCRSGGFIDNLRNNKTFISTAAAATQNAYPADTENESYGGKTYSHGEYNYYIISAFNRSHPGADANGNGKVSCMEAHSWEVSHESSPNEVPQFSDIGGIGPNSYLTD